LAAGALALLTAPNRPLQQLTRGLIFLPVVIGIGSSSLLWFWLFDQQVGMFNRILVDIGLLSEPMVWFTKADPALLAVTISITWKVIGFGMLLFVAGIQSINGEIGEVDVVRCVPADRDTGLGQRDRAHDLPPVGSA
jgi:multiple sugar transport system permease protein